MIIAEALNTTQTVTQTGVGIGSIIAVVCSWERNKSIFWAIIAAVLSWIYVIYFGVTRTRKESPRDHFDDGRSGTFRKKP